jgi:hypothetical protein
MPNSYVDLSRPSFFFPQLLGYALYDELLFQLSLTERLYVEALKSEQLHSPTFFLLFQFRAVFQVLTPSL